MTAQVVICAVGRENMLRLYLTLKKFDLKSGFILWPSNCSVGSQDQSSKQLLWEREKKFIWMSKNNNNKAWGNEAKKRGKADFIHAVEKGPVRRTVADTLAKVHQVTATELHTAEGGNELLDVLKHFSGLDWGKKWNGFSVVSPFGIIFTDKILHGCKIEPKNQWDQPLTPVTAGIW